LCGKYPYIKDKTMNVFVEEHLRVIAVCMTVKMLELMTHIIKATITEQFVSIHFFTVEISTKGYGENIASAAINPSNNHGGP